ncbi:MAG: IS91 family transposase, partial [Proteobacteria bacterium]|nr:IS91 family transposase [Pseudomonadota bacterium]
MFPINVKETRRPKCQYHKTREWLEKQLNKQVPGQYFMI